MIEIIFETHATTIDNERQVASGHYDVGLSAVGVKQAKELGKRYSDENFDAVFCSDLQRSYKTAEIAFAGRTFPIVRDKRLRECNYGYLTRHSKEVVDKAKLEHIQKPFPNGESYEQTNQRMKGFLEDLFKKHNGKKVMIIGHRATQYGLEHWINRVPLKEIIAADWKWQPGWKYKLVKI